jgi:hypothetical protein
MPNGLALKTNGAQAYYPYLTQVVLNVPYRAPAPAGHRAYPLLDIEDQTAVGSAL